MVSARSFVRRLLAVFLLAALFGGPAGMAGTLHPADDLACAPIDDAGTEQGAFTTVQVENAHCPTCHLLRSLRFGVTADLAPVLVALVSVAVCGDSITSPVCDPLPTTPGRSPPPPAFG